ncbi:MAG: magnesium transporter CorA family protein [Clostridia bacterium]|nr:magnesium transporter CorA family protein [Clostridia bacterium]
MIKIVSTVGHQFRELENIEDNCWIHLGDPTEKEISRICTVLGIDKDLLHAPLDEEESSRLDYEDGVNIVIVDIPHIVPTNDGFSYETIPLGVFITEKNIVTVCTDEDSLVEDFWNGRVRDFDTAKKTRFLLQLLYRNAIRYLSYLKMIDKASDQLENVLHKSMKNRELIQMLRLNKSLVYFSTSLKGNEVILEKIMRSHNIIKYEEDSELLEDVITENKQAIEMAGIYMDILTGTMDAFASLVSNNQNIIMKFLAATTILLEIPTIISGFWGMNFASMPFMETPGGFYIIIGASALIVLIVGIIFWKKKMF